MTLGHDEIPEQRIGIRRPVMMDVARLAHVSHQTVSRVLNDRESVSDATRRRVETAIVQLGYRRNTAARALVTRRTFTLGVVSVDTSNYGPARTLFAIESAARRAGYFVALASAASSRSGMQGALDHLTTASVDGIVVIAPTHAAVEAVNAQQLEVPLVMVEASHRTDALGVVVDQVAGARMATRHLLQLGHRSVVHVRGPENWFEADARAAGWLTELIQARAVVPEMLGGDWSSRSGYEAGRLIASRRDVTAVFAANDQMALGVSRALHEAGRNVPADVSVVGFDDIPEAEHFYPPLTTVRQDFAEVGYRCIQRLLALIDGRVASSWASLQPDLVVRESSGPPPPRH